jgi:haloalkane dehalogenase
MDDMTLAFVQHPVRYVDTPWATVAYRQFGVGDPLLLLHGWPLSGVTFRKVIPHLQDRFTCYVPDLPGAGETRWGERTDFSWPGQARTVKAFVDGLGLKKYFLLGQDSGAMIGRCLALIDETRIERFAMTNTEVPGHRPPWIPLYRLLMFLPGTNSVLRLVLRSHLFLRSPLGFGGAFNNPKLITGDFHDLIIQPMILSPTRMMGHNRFLRGWDWKLLDAMEKEHAKIVMPVLFVWGAADKTFPLSLAQDMAQQFPHCVGIRATDRARVFVQEEAPEFLANALIEFFCT